MNKKLISDRQDLLENNLAPSACSRTWWRAARDLEMAYILSGNSVGSIYTLRQPLRCMEIKRNSNKDHLVYIPSGDKVIVSGKIFMNLRRMYALPLYTHDRVVQVVLWRFMLAL